MKVEERFSSRRRQLSSSFGQSKKSSSGSEHTTDCSSIDEIAMLGAGVHRSPSGRGKTHVISVAPFHHRSDSVPSRKRTSPNSKSNKNKLFAKKTTSVKPESHLASISTKRPIVINNTPRIVQKRPENKKPYEDKTHHGNKHPSNKHHSTKHQQSKDNTRTVETTTVAEIGVDEYKTCTGKLTIDNRIPSSSRFHREITGSEGSGKYVKVTESRRFLDMIPKIPTMDSDSSIEAKAGCKFSL